MTPKGYDDLARRISLEEYNLIKVVKLKRSNPQNPVATPRQSAHGMVYNISDLSTFENQLRTLKASCGYPSILRLSQDPRSSAPSRHLDHPLLSLPERTHHLHPQPQILLMGRLHPGFLVVLYRPSREADRHT
jgi:hypothetical protein